MMRLLRDKKVIFFDVGNTLDEPASGDWMLTNRFLGLAGGRLRSCGEGDVREAMRDGFRFLTENHRVASVEEEIRQFTAFYSLLSSRLDLHLSEGDAEEIARDRARSMDNYVPCPGAREVLEALSETHRLGVISDTWPSVVMQLDHLGVSRYLSFRTFSCFVGVFKPDRRIYLDALGQCGVPAEETVFVDDSVRNLEGAAALGITPVLIAPGPDAGEVPPGMTVIRDLRELIRE